MPTPIDLRPETEHELVLARHLEAPRAAVWRCWTDGTLMPHWFCPAPWRVSHAELTVRPGGTSRIVMNGPAGEVVDNVGIYLEVVPERRLVFTDAFTRAWVPSAKPFMVGVIELADAEGGTRYVARVLHWTAADREAHETMGFHEGWGSVAAQLEDLARRIGRGEVP